MLKHKVSNGFATISDEIVILVNRARPVPATNASRSERELSMGLALAVVVAVDCVRLA